MLFYQLMSRLRASAVLTSNKSLEERGLEHGACCGSPCRSATLPS
jgi:hypothetical protein